MAKRRRYSASYSSPDAEVTFTMKDGEVSLYLVVWALSSHTTYVWEAGFPKIKKIPLRDKRQAMRCLKATGLVYP